LEKEITMNIWQIILLLTLLLQISTNFNKFSINQQWWKTYNVDMQLVLIAKSCKATLRKHPKKNYFTQIFSICRPLSINQSINQSEIA